MESAGTTSAVPLRVMHENTSVFKNAMSGGNAPASSNTSFVNHGTLVFSDFVVEFLYGQLLQTDLRFG